MLVALRVFQDAREKSLKAVVGFRDAYVFGILQGGSGGGGGSWEGAEKDSAYFFFL